MRSKIYMKLFLIKSWKNWYNNQTWASCFKARKVGGAKNQIPSTVFLLTYICYLILGFQDHAVPTKYFSLRGKINPAGLEAVTTSTTQGKLAFTKPIKFVWTRRAGEAFEVLSVEETLSLTCLLELWTTSTYLRTILQGNKTYTYSL